MKTIIIDSIDSSYTVALPKNTAYYFTLYSRTGENLTDSGVLSVTTTSSSVYPVIDASNIDPDDYPLSLVYFTAVDLSEGETKLFDQSADSPASDSRFAVGKRKDDCKNIEYSDLSSFVTGGGNDYVKKDNNLSDVKAEDVRDVLSVYSKRYIDNLNLNYISNEGNFTYTTNGTLSASNILYSAIGYDESSLSPFGYPSDYTIETQMIGSLCNVRITFDVGAFNFFSYSSYGYCFDVSSFVDGRDIVLPSPIIVPATSSYLPFNGTWDHCIMGNDGMEIVVDGTSTFSSFEGLPQLVVTGDQPFKFRGGNIPKNKVYVVWPNSKKYSLSSRCDLERNINLVYEFNFVPNDSQLN